LIGGAQIVSLGWIWLGKAVKTRKGADEVLKNQPSLQYTVGGSGQREIHYR